ncbi:hypothetical protein M8J75_016529 [Diaphorina citri]|nr:hypothetical protein M8J75_016529 [Diaphorina citri]
MDKFLVRGVALVYVGQPLDTVKVKMQTYPQLYSSMIDCCKKVWRDEGLVRGLYAGTIPAILANVAENSVLFACYGFCQKIISLSTGTKNVEDMSILANASAGYGLRGLFKGFGPTVAREMPGYFVFFGGYEATRTLLAPADKPKEECGALATMAAGGVGGIALWTVIFPVDVIKSRVQASSQQNTANFVTQMTDIVKKEGVLALYNGLQPTLIRTIPASAVLFLVYEYSKKIMNTLFL